MVAPFSRVFHGAVLASLLCDVQSNLTLSPSECWVLSAQGSFDHFYEAVEVSFGNSWYSRHPWITTFGNWTATATSDGHVLHCLRTTVTPWRGDATPRVTWPLLCQTELRTPKWVSIPNQAHVCQIQPAFPIQIAKQLQLFLCCDVEP